MSLSREIIKRILFGVGAIPEHFGKCALTLPEFQLDEKFFVRYDNGDKIGFSLWAGEGILPNMKIRALLLDLSVENTQVPGVVCNDPEDWKFEHEAATEYSLALRVDDKPIYLLRLAYDNEDNGDFLVQDGDRWIVPKILIQSWALIGMETIVDQGMVWNPSSSYEDLLQAIAKIVEI